MIWRNGWTVNAFFGTRPRRADLHPGRPSSSAVPVPPVLLPNESSRRSVSRWSWLPRGTELDEIENRRFAGTPNDDTLRARWKFHPIQTLLPALPRTSI
jgi:hypothetical protein